MSSGFQIAQLQAHGYETQSGRFMGPSAGLIVKAIGLGSSDVVLDLACGTGLIARHARPKVGPDGRVVAADLNPAMLAVAESLGGSSIEWTEASADNMPFDNATFTHVACQQGFQFFPDALAAAREVHRVLRPGGMLAATIWATPGRNPYIETQLTLLAELDETISGSASGATPVGADALLRRITTDAGFRDVELSLLEHLVEIDDLGAYFIDQTATTPWAPVIAVLSPSEKAQLAEEFVSRLDSCADAAGSHHLPFCSHMVRCFA